MLSSGLVPISISLLFNKHFSLPSHREMSTKCNIEGARVFEICKMINPPYPRWRYDVRHQGVLKGRVVGLFSNVMRFMGGLGVCVGWYRSVTSAPVTIPSSNKNHLNHRLSAASVVLHNRQTLRRILTLCLCEHPWRWLVNAKWHRGGSSNRSSMEENSGATKWKDLSVPVKKMSWKEVIVSLCVVIC